MDNMVGLLYGCEDGMNTIALAIGVPLMNVVAVGLRFYTRRRQEATIGIDDWWSLGALILLIAMGADLLIAAVNQVLSCPQPNDEVARLAMLGPLVSRAAWAFYLMGVVGVGLVKMTFLYCMRRVFCTGEKGTLFSKITYSVMAVVCAWTIGFLITMVVINVNWGQPDQGDPSQWANAPASRTTDMMFFALTVSDVIIDGIIMILPILVIWRLNLSLGRKFAISGIFLLRLLALGASVTRMSYTVMFSRWMGDLLSVDPTLSDPDHLLIGTNLNTQMIWWTMFEVGFGLFASCITTVQFLLRREHVEHALDRVRGILGLEVPDRRRLSDTPASSSRELRLPCHNRAGSRHGTLYLGDDRSIISAEYMIGSVRPSASIEAMKAESDTTVETRQIYVRKTSNASLSVTEEESEAETERGDAIGHAV